MVFFGGAGRLETIVEAFEVWENNAYIGGNFGLMKDGIYVLVIVIEGLLYADKNIGIED